MRIALIVLLALSLGLNIWLQTTLSDANDLIQKSTEAWKYLDTAPVYVQKDLVTGDIYVLVPYRKKPYTYPKVCMPERSL